MNRNSDVLKVVLVFVMVGLSACKYLSINSDDRKNSASKVQLKNHSVTPAFVKGLPEGVEVYSLISSDDQLDRSPDFIFGGSADGLGIVKGRAGTYTMLVNHEDNYSVSRITLDETFKPVHGEYLINSDQGRFRLCSATMATPAVQGFGPLYFTAGESGVESLIHTVEPEGAVNSSRLMKGFGNWSAENAVPLPQEAVPGKTAVIIGDDDSGTYGGQIAMYLGNSIGDLNNGNLYVLARANSNTRERDMKIGQTYDVEFRQIENQKSLTGAEINAKTGELKAIQFGRVEDLDFSKDKKSKGREIYFNVTGQDDSGANANYDRTQFGRVYRLTLDKDNPAKGTLEVLLDGDNRNGPAGQFQNPDNIMVTENYVYIQEDPNGYSRNSDPSDDETHDAYIYQYHIHTGELKVVMELDHNRDNPKYNPNGPGRLGGWEYGTMRDISDLIKIPDTFLLAIQPHTWRDEKYAGVDGGALRANENQASEVIIVKGLPR